MCLLIGAAARAQEALDGDDVSDIDTETSLDIEELDVQAATFAGDMRGGYFYVDRDQRDGGSENEDSLDLRVRYGADIGFARFARIKARLAAVCSTDDCSPSSGITSHPNGGNSIEPGEVAIDEFFLHLFRFEKLDLSLGRMQTRAVSRVGAYAKSLDRANSNNVRVNWTDGLFARHQADNGWDSSLIVQRNTADGTGSVTRNPLDFETSSSRISYFYGIENVRPLGPIKQRAFDITFMPDALLKDGTRDGRTEDYWGFVGRVGAEWPAEPEGMSLAVAAELAYAPDTQTKAAASIGADGDVDGIGWYVEASLMNIRGGHSFGVNYGRLDPGWLLSPQYRPNDETLELRYYWQFRNRGLIEVRGRWREEIDQLIGSQRPRETFDFFARFTRRFKSFRRETRWSKIGYE